MLSKYKKTDVKSGRIGGLFYRDEVAEGPMLVILNQWRSSSRSLFSKYLAEMVLDKGVYTTVLFIDRIASGGASDETLSENERKNMRTLGEFQFGKLYARAIGDIRKKHGLPDKYAIGGSSAGAPAVVATALEMSRDERTHVLALVPVEPSGMMMNGFGKKRVGAVPLAFAKHLAAYRHRVQRGWWTPMDKEQYFARAGKMFEYRANWWAGDGVFQALCTLLCDPEMPPTELVLSKTSHIHNQAVREALKDCTVKPHKIKEITGNHDKICQPPSLSEIYSDAVGLVSRKER